MMMTLNISLDLMVLMITLVIHIIFEIFNILRKLDREVYNKLYDKDSEHFSSFKDNLHNFYDLNIFYILSIFEKIANHIDFADLGVSNILNRFY